MILINLNNRLKLKIKNYLGKMSRIYSENPENPENLDSNKKRVKIYEQNYLKFNTPVVFSTINLCTLKIRLNKFSITL